MIIPKKCIFFFKKNKTVQLLEFLISISRIFQEFFQGFPRFFQEFKKKLKNPTSTIPLQQLENAFDPQERPQQPRPSEEG
jgi:hypothetical protein